MPIKKYNRNFFFFFVVDTHNRNFVFIAYCLYNKRVSIGLNNSKKKQNDNY